MNPLEGPSTTECFDDRTKTSVRGDREPFDQRRVRQGLLSSDELVLSIRFIPTSERARVRGALLQRRPCLEERFFEAAADGHHLTSGFHGGSKRTIRSPEFVEGPAWDLDHAIIQGWLERGCRPFSCDGIGELMQMVTNSDLGGHAGDRISGGFGSEGARARNPGIDLDHAVFPRRLIECELNVASPGCRVHV